MHYYRFNIAAYVMLTHRLQPTHELIYLRLKNAYYSRERPIPNVIEEICDLIYMDGQDENIWFVLNKFFYQKTKGGDWFNNEFELEIEEYHVRQTTTRKPRRTAVEREAESLRREMAVSEETFKRRFPGDWKT